MNQFEDIKVRDYMTRQPIVVQNTARLTVAIREMDSHNISVLPVVDEQGNLTGVLSNSDLIEILHEVQSDLGALKKVNEKTREFLISLLVKQGDNTLVMDVMTEPVETIAEDANFMLAAKILTKRGLHHLLVVNDKNLPIGILGASDLVRAISEFDESDEVASL